MNKKLSRNFFVSFHKENDMCRAHMVSSTPPEKGWEIPPSTPLPKKDTQTSKELPFKAVYDSFISVMGSYRKFIPLTLALAPVLSSIVVEKSINGFAKAKGSRRDDLSNEKTEVYELDLRFYREFSIKNCEANAAVDGAGHLPEVMVIGLVSAYDAFLSRLLHVVLNTHPEIVLTSDKVIKFSEISKYSSIDEVRATLIDREIESIIRLSHHEQFSRMEELFSLKLRENLSVWPSFIELCERRNLLTHTGGIVSAQYIANCKSQNCDVLGIKIGTKLEVGSEYFSKAVDIINEIGIKLCYVLWRKFARQEYEEADSSLNEEAYNLIFGRAYGVAESLLSFGADTLKKQKGSNSNRLMMIVNLANTLRLQKREEDAKKILDEEDWSATNNNFKICVAAVRGEIDRVVELMEKNGADVRPNAEDYRTWPVFIGINTDDRFVSAFERIFGEPFITPSTIDITAPPKKADIITPELPPTKH